MSKDLEQVRFCPYCGKQLSRRSKYCPYCGKASPRRLSGKTGSPEMTAVSVAPLAESKEQSRSAASGHGAARSAAVDGVERGQPRSSGAGPNGAFRLAPAGVAGIPVTSVARRYAPPTHALIGAFEQAGFGLRYGAWMFDFLITLIGMMVFTFVVTAWSHKSVVGSNRDLVIVAALTVLLVVVNFVVLAGANGQTAGMRILGIYIMRIDGNSFNKKQAAIRHLIGYPLSMAALFLGFLWMLWDPRQQGWHDKLAKTIVVMSR